MIFSSPTAQATKVLSFSRETVNERISKSYDSVLFWRRSYCCWLEIRSGSRRRGNLKLALEANKSIENVLFQLDKEETRLVYWLSI